MYPTVDCFKTDKSIYYPPLLVLCVHRSMINHNTLTAMAMPTTLRSPVK